MGTDGERSAVPIVRFQDLGNYQAMRAALHLVVFGALALGVAFGTFGCWRRSLISDAEIQQHAGRTLERVRYLSAVPEDFRAAFRRSVNPLAALDLATVPKSERQRFAEAASREIEVLDSAANWSSAPEGSVQFLEAGRIATGWWIFYRCSGFTETRHISVFVDSSEGPKLIRDEPL